MSSIDQHFQEDHWNFLKRLAAACIQAGGRAYLVGGCVRSALLDEPVLDFDVEVFGLAPTQLEKLIEKLSPVSRVGRAFGIYKLTGWPIDVGLPRKEKKSGTGHRAFEVDIDPDMSLEDAALRRDFTMNALYFDIEASQIIDPLNGLKDLQQKCLRHCSDRFPEDPLRVLRAMQFAARIPAQVAPETIKLCAGLTPENLSRERFFAEWEKLLLSGKAPSVGLNFLKDCQWLRFFPGLQAMVNCPQDTSWHPEGDVWVHTLHCMDAFAKKRVGNREEDLIVGFAVLCHDMGKPLVTEFIDGKVRSPAHEVKGLKPAREFLQKLNVPMRLMEQILPLVKCHMRPAALFNGKSSPAAIRRLARDCGRMDRLLRVFEADSAGRPPLPDNSAEALAWLNEQAHLLNVQRAKPKPLIKGADLLLRGWESGPPMGQFLDKAYEAQLDGAFTTREEALKWLKAQDAGTSTSKVTQSETP